MKMQWILAGALLAGCVLDRAHGQDDEADRAALQQELEQARQEVAEAAQRMARLQRELALGEKGSVHRWMRENGEELRSGIELDLERARSFAFRAFPPRLGVLLGSDDSDQAGVIIGLTPGGGAEEAGLERGDRLISINGEPLGDGPSQAVREALAELDPGSVVSVTVERDGAERVFDVQTGSAMRDVRVMFERLTPGELGPLPGLTPRLTVLGRGTELIGNHAGLEPYFGTGQGVLVLRIDPDNPLNLESGDVVLSVEGESVDGPVDLGRLLMEREPGTDITLEVMRQKMPTEVYGTLPETGTSAKRPMSFFRARADGHL